MDFDDLYLGRVIRKVRSEKGITLKELAKGTCWTSSTISRFEKNKTTPHSKEKVQQLLERLGIMEKQIPHLIAEEKKEELIRNYMFRSTESGIKSNSLTWTRLKEKLDMINHSTAVKYLRGKFYFMQNEVKGEENYETAIKCYLSVIAEEEDEHYPESNIIPSAYLDLAVISYNNSNYAQAIEYLNQGLERFDPKGAKSNIKYALCYNKALFLEQLGRIEEANQALEIAWREREKIYDILTRIKVYQLKASILRQQNRLQEAYEVLSEGFDIANGNPLLIDGQYYILIELGETTYDLGKYDYSERCLLAALDIKKKLIKAKPTMAHITLGKIYYHTDRLKEAKIQAKNAINAEKFRPISRQKLIQAHILLGNIYEKEQNKYDSCLHYETAWDLADKYHFDQYKPELHEHLYRCKNS